MELPSNFVVRNLEANDYGKGFMSLLGQLTNVDGHSEQKFAAQFAYLQRYSDIHVIRVIEDTLASKIIASATLMIEKKFIHDNGSVGHIEDVVVDSAYRGHNFGRLYVNASTGRSHAARIIRELMTIAENASCYKVILDCAEKNVCFYEKAGFKRKEITMAWYTSSDSQLML
eukprot:TRINITY_DN6424_c0_g1_i3.p1 TRINITY_DN6424_c0_g1~~TRINITY_DN6424_c0_g1_i3.p1  ORF type:complete len:172 (+),score=29.85 TRINITY_DN6424_c0_g1_i3:91-606(+)